MNKLNSIKALLIGIGIFLISIYMLFKTPYEMFLTSVLPIGLIALIVMLYAVWMAYKGK